MFSVEPRQRHRDVGQRLGVDTGGRRVGPQAIAVWVQEPIGGVRGVGAEPAAFGAESGLFGSIAGP